MLQLLGQRVRERRKAAGMSQAQFARRLGLESESSIYKLESGRSQPSLLLLIRIANVLHVSIDYLLGIVDSPATRDEQVQRPTHDVTGVEKQEAQGGAQVAQLFGPKLQRLRQLLGWSQSDLARKLGIESPAYINRMESGSQLPSLRVLVAIAQLFTVRAEALLRDTIPMGELQAAPGSKAPDVD